LGIEGEREREKLERNFKLGGVVSSQQVVFFLVVVGSLVLRSVIGGKWGGMIFVEKYAVWGYREKEKPTSLACVTKIEKYIY
jgi:hypothetical protein